MSLAEERRNDRQTFELEAKRVRNKDKLEGKVQRKRAEKSFSVHTNSKVKAAADLRQIVVHAAALAIRRRVEEGKPQAGVPVQLPVVCW